mgnify:CR=1 FL=1
MQDRGERSEVSPGQGVRQYAGATGISRQRACHIYVSWLHPYKQQLLVVAGSKGMLSFDDAADGKEIRFYNKRIDFENGVPVKVEAPDEIIPYEKKMPWKRN